MVRTQVMRRNVYAEILLPKEYVWSITMFVAGRAVSSRDTEWSSGRLRLQLRMPVYERRHARRRRTVPAKAYSAGPPKMRARHNELVMVYIQGLNI